MVELGRRRPCRFPEGRGGTRKGKVSKDVEDGREGVCRALGRVLDEQGARKEAGGIKSSNSPAQSRPMILVPPMVVFTIGMTS